MVSARVVVRGNCDWCLLAATLVLQCCVGACTSTNVAMIVILISIAEDRTVSQCVMLYEQKTANLFNVCGLLYWYLLFHDASYTLINLSWFSPGHTCCKTFATACQMHLGGSNPEPAFSIKKMVDQTPFITQKSLVTHRSKVAAAPIKSIALGSTISHAVTSTHFQHM